MEKSDVMTCRNYRAGSCPKSDPIVLQEDQFHVQMGCRTCRCGWIVTMPDGKARARYENRIAEIKRQEALRREREQAPVYFT